MIWFISRLPPFNTSNLHILSSPTQLCAPISTKSSSLSPKIEKSDSPIWSSSKIYVGQKLKYTSNFSVVVDGIDVLSIYNNTSEDLKCGFHYTIKKSNRVYSTHLRRQFIFKKLLFKISSYVIKHQSHSHHKQPLLSIHQKYFLLLCSQWIPHPCKNYQQTTTRPIWWDVHYFSSKWSI